MLSYTSQHASAHNFHLTCAAQNEKDTTISLHSRLQGTPPPIHTDGKANSRGSPRVDVAISTRADADGLQGGESTFGAEYGFANHLRDSVAKELPKVDVKVLVYPKYETRGDLLDCVGRFTDWYATDSSHTLLLMRHIYSHSPGSSKRS